MKFQELEINKKIEYLLSILHDMKWFNKSVDKIIISLQNWEIQESWEIDRIYNLTMESIKESNKEYDKCRIDNFEKNKNLVAYLKWKEEQEKLLEQNNIELFY